ncbi:MAG: lycopene cyclase domain-containing protein [Crocinitomicaceae bacterium]|nr:lycopene cyclase domain-containing protein [Crocinitomicaceae bacterium]
MSAYFYVLISSIVFPFFLSFDKKISFYKKWKFLFPSIFLVAIVFIAWDIYFVKNGVWGFNKAYLSGLYVFNLPIEEVLFFVIIPYCCMFIYEVVKGYFPEINFKKLTDFFSLLFVVLGVFMACFFMEKVYTLTACSLAVLLTIYSYKNYKNFSFFVPSYLISLFPFILVNGVLTGIATSSPIVWYSEMEIIGLRVLTIPIEDFFYSYSMLLSVAILSEKVSNLFTKTSV